MNKPIVKPSVNPPINPPVNPPFSERCLYPRLDCDGNLAYTPVLTHASRTDTVDILMGALQVLPIVFVPGTMGSNLRNIKTKTPAWRFDGEISIAYQQSGKSAGDRQRLLHPNRTEVDPDGQIPSKVGVLTRPEDFRQRGWGEVAAASYGEFLIWMEETFHGQRAAGRDGSPHVQLNTRLRSITDGLRWRNKDYVPLTQAECAKAENWNYPVYAFGYNWLQSCDASAIELAARINMIIVANNTRYSHCEQVIVVTHSMGGLVARRCAQLPDMASRITGVVHGVMPALGAAVAYRRCKVGMWDENWKASLVIGRNGQEITAVFAQAPGALELLPSGEYRSNWLQFEFGGERPMPYGTVTGDGYQMIFLARYKWWGLIKEEWLKPRGGTPIDWDTYLKAMNSANNFQNSIRKSYHANSWAFYGVGIPSFESVFWKREESIIKYRAIAEDPPTTQEIMNATGQNPEMDSHGIYHHMPKQVFLDGGNAAAVYGAYIDPKNPGARVPISIPSVYYYLRAAPASEDGDGTVPLSSGNAPEPYIKQIFGVNGLSHEPAFMHADARDITAYAIAKIAAQTISCFNEKSKNGTN